MNIGYAIRLHTTDLAVFHMISDGVHACSDYDATHNYKQLVGALATSKNNDPWTPTDDTNLSIFSNRDKLTVVMTSRKRKQTWNLDLLSCREI